MHLDVVFFTTTEEEDEVVVEEEPEEERGGEGWRHYAELAGRLFWLFCSFCSC